MTSEAPLSLARSEGRGSKASGSVAGAMMLSSAARGTNRARATSGLRRRSPAGNEHALGQQAVHALFVAGRGRRDATVHGNAGQSVGIEPGQLAAPAAG